MKIREKNPDLKNLVMNLQKGKQAWRAVAEGLNRPRRGRHEVNLYRIEKHANPKESVVVPGIVLGDGEIKKSVVVAALKFTKGAREKIEKAGGRCLSIEELLEKNPKGEKLRIMG